MRKLTKACTTCGKHFTRHSNSHRFCRSCSAARRKEQVERAMKRYGFRLRADAEAYRKLLAEQLSAK